jgi:2-keto-4-pentenoate hydratase/2-oxohepta-3-ene-1,7-dioic acid hydratase in catechol pathway
LRCVTFRRAGEREPRFGALVDGGRRILDFHHSASEVERPANHLDWFDLGGPWSQAASARHASVTRDNELLEELVKKGAAPGNDEADLLAPIPRPGAIIGIGRNYAAHAAERGAETPTEPLCFAKANSSIIAPGQAITLPLDSEEVDFEAELAVILGRRAHRVAESDALDYVFGYAIINDITARDFQKRDRSWLRAKGCDGFAPFGPFIAERALVPNAGDLGIRLRLNGEIMQEGTTSDMIFSVPQIISYISRFRTLHPGDVIATGTPSGVGASRNPPVFLRDGDHLEIEIDGLGVLRNPVQGPASED